MTSKAPILGNIAKRTLAAQSQPQATIKQTCINTKTLPSKLVLASYDNEAPIARVAVVVRAGSRFETTDNLGAAHTIRSSAGLSTEKLNHIDIARTLQQSGSGLTCTSDRETITYTLETNRDNWKEGVAVLKNIVGGQIFKPWELQDNTKRIKVDLKTRPWMTRSVDLLHKAAFRKGLGNSMYCPKFNAGKLDSETLRGYFLQTFTTNRTAIAGVGIDIGELEFLASELCLPSGDGPKPCGNFYGNVDQRLEKNLGLAYFSVAAPGVGISNRKELLALGVLRHILSGNPHVKWGNPSGTLGEAVRCLGLNDPVAVNALNIAYSDLGLFGFSAITIPRNAGQVLGACVNELKNPKVTDENIQSGKKSLTSEVLLAIESNESMLNELGQQAALTGDVVSPDALVKEIAAISSNDVKQAATKVGSSKLSLGAIGNLGCLPYIDEL